MFLDNKRHLSPQEFGKNNTSTTFRDYPHYNATQNGAYRIGAYIFKKNESPRNRTPKKAACTQNHQQYKTLLDSKIPTDRVLQIESPLTVHSCSQYLMISLIREPLRTIYTCGSNRPDPRLSLESVIIIGLRSLSCTCPFGRVRLKG